MMRHWLLPLLIAAIIASVFYHATLLAIPFALMCVAMSKIDGRALRFPPPWVVANLQQFVADDLGWNDLTFGGGPLWPSQASVPINIDKDLSQADAPDDEYIYWSN